MESLIQATTSCLSWASLVMATSPTASSAEAAVQMERQQEERYQHQALPDNSSHFRLATLYPSPSFGAPTCCSLSTHALEDAPPSTALSYVCGDPQDILPVFVNGKNFAVYHNLEMGIRHIRDSEISLVIWIDALCTYPDQSRIKHLRNLRIETRGSFNDPTWMES